jgi:hypothetical protein
MYELLFSLSGVAIISWILMIFLPKWKVTYMIAKWAVFPLTLSVAYLVGIAYYIANHGLSFTNGFGSYEGVLQLLTVPDLAIIAWLHILAFDQLVGRMIYMENMEHRKVHLILQSLCLYLTLMVGPIGYLLYIVLKKKRQGNDARQGEEKVA